MYIIIILPQSLSFPLPVTCETSIVQSSPGQSPESPGASAMGNSTAGQNAVIENYSVSDFYFLYFSKKNLKLIGKKTNGNSNWCPLSNKVVPGSNMIMLDPC